MPTVEASVENAYNKQEYQTGLLFYLSSVNSIFYCEVVSVFTVSTKQ